jgi:hypothetical protein
LSLCACVPLSLGLSASADSSLLLSPFFDGVVKILEGADQHGRQHTENRSSDNPIR